MRRAITVAPYSEAWPDAALVAGYAALKQNLALRLRHDPARYTDAKGPFIRGVVAHATRYTFSKR
jgi:GrpB-like predicted nucleotidyltransferase (UPF0157 family)